MREGDGPESRHLRPVEALLDEVADGRVGCCKHPWDRPHGPRRSRLDSLRREGWYWKPGDGWKRAT